MELEESGYLRVKVQEVEMLMPIYGELPEGKELREETDESFCPNPFDM